MYDKASEFISAMWGHRMTETAEQTKQDEATATVDGFAAREKKRKEDHDQQVQEQAARTREGWRAQWEKDGVSSFVTPQALNQFASMWKGADVQAIEFAAGISNIVDIQQEKKAPHIHTLTSKFGGQFSYINQGGGEFIGLTAKQAKKAPMTEQTADDIALTAFARGWKNVTVSGSAAEKDMLWIAAQKYGLAVTNYVPSQEARNAFEDYKTKANEAAAGMTEGQPEAAAATPNVPVKVETSPVVAEPRSRFQEEDIIDAEFTEIEPETKFAKKVEGPAAPKLLEGPKNNPPSL